MTFSVDDIGESIGVDLEHPQLCRSSKMIKFLFAFCRAGDEKADLVHDKDVLERVFERVKGLANEEKSGLKAYLTKL